MLNKALESNIPTAIIITLSILYSLYWMFMSSDIFWRFSVGIYNIVYLCFYVALSLAAILFLARENKKWYTIFSFFAFIPAVIVCFINRYSRYPDFASIALQYIADNPSEPINQYMNSIYSSNWMFYDYIISRSGKASSALSILVLLWAFSLFYPIIKKE